MRCLFGNHQPVSIGILFFISVMVLGVACAGDSGVTGAPGQVGPTGPQGQDGVEGPRGDPGVAGPAGSVGPTGARGPAGPAGSAGPTGARGPAGPAGSAGLTGARGPTGDRGLEGPTGPSVQIVSIVNAPVVPNGTVAHAATEFVINLDVSMDPKVPGKSLLKGNTIKITLPDDFEDSGAPLFQGVGTENCTPGNLQCSTGVLLQGWPQHPIRPPFKKYDISLESSNTIVFTALEDILAQPPLEPGIKQVHLILKRFTNPAAGQYGVRIVAETGSSGELETGWGQLHIIPQTRPSISVTSAFNPGTPNTIYQQSTPGASPPFQYDLLLWDAQGEALERVTIVKGPTSHVWNLVQVGSVVGRVILDAPGGATGNIVFTESPSVKINAPVTGVPTGHMVAKFRAGSTPGDYLVTFKLIGGNSIQMFVAVQ